MGWGEPAPSWCGHNSLVTSAWGGWVSLGAINYLRIPQVHDKCIGGGSLCNLASIVEHDSDLGLARSRTQTSCWVTHTTRAVTTSHGLLAAIDPKRYVTRGERPSHHQREPVQVEPVRVGIGMCCYQLGPQRKEGQLQLSQHIVVFWATRVT
jgi:hypothetical protein